MNLAQLEIKLILATLFQKYDFEIKSPVNADHIDTQYKLTYAPKDVLFGVR
jgi:hypothetical protein